MSEERDSEAEYVRQTETDTICRVEVTGEPHTVHRRDTSEEREIDSDGGMSEGGTVIGNTGKLNEISTSLEVSENEAQTNDA